MPEMLAAACEGDDRALTELYRAYQPPLIRYLRAQEPRVADDLASEVWICVARGLGRFSGDEAGFRSWLFTIARRRLTEHRRRMVRQRTDPVPQDRFDDVDVPCDAVDPARIVLDLLGAQHAVDLLVAGLTPDQAEAVLLRVVGGFGVAEVAHLMDRTPGSVRVLCHRALRSLATQFDEGVLAE